MRFIFAFKPFRVLPIGILTAILLLLSGCSGVPVTQDYSNRSLLTNYSTYQWLPEHLQTSPSANELKRSEPFIAKRIENAILNNLHKRGALIVRQAPQAYISYSYSVIKNQVVSPSSTIGIGWHSRNIGFGTRFPLGYEAEVYDEAKWTINIYDPKGTLIWRGGSIQTVENFSSPQAAEQSTQALVDAILNQYPPK